MWQLGSSFHLSGRCSQMLKLWSPAGLTEMLAWLCLLFSMYPQELSFLHHLF
jgi:hypothetical protein